MLISHQDDRQLISVSHIEGFDCQPEGVFNGTRGKDSPRKLTVRSVYAELKIALPCSGGQTYSWSRTLRINNDDWRLTNPCQAQALYHKAQASTGARPKRTG